MSDPSSQMRFAAGHEAGAVACALCSNGVMVEAEPDLGAAIELTQQLITMPHDGAVFEATFAHEGVLVRVDIMEPDGAGGWSVAEVKSSTSAKDYHAGDLATQIWVMSNCGVSISSAAIRHIDKSFVLTTAGDYRGLFADVGLGDALQPIIANRANVVARAQAILAGPEPIIGMGDHCSSPFECEFVGYCSAECDVVEWPIALLPYSGRAVAAKWAGEGIHDLFDVPVGKLDSALHNRIHQATISGTTYHDRAGALAATSGWAYPRLYLDFETIAFAVPRWIGTQPYQQVPFQFSCHIEQEDGRIAHHDFLSLDGVDPRRACAEALVACCAEAPGGAIIAYNAGFERGCIRGLAAHCPDLAPDLAAIEARVVDLLPVTRANYYHRDQRGSWSIKAVLPTVAAELDYGALEVKDGVNAQAAYLEAISGDASPTRRRAIEAALLAYCARDTEAMIVLLKRLIGDAD